MGIPILDLGRKYGKINSADCMGCGRCITVCHVNSLAFHDIRDVILPGKTRDREFLFKTNRITKKKAEFIIILTALLVILFLIAYLSTTSHLTENKSICFLLKEAKEGEVAAAVEEENVSS